MTTGEFITISKNDLSKYGRKGGTTRFKRVGKRGMGKMSKDFWNSAAGNKERERRKKNAKQRIHNA